MPRAESTLAMASVTGDTEAAARVRGGQRPCLRHADVKRQSSFPVPRIQAGPVSMLTHETWQRWYPGTSVFWPKVRLVGEASCGAGCPWGTKPAPGEGSPRSMGVGYPQVPLGGGEGTHRTWSGCSLLSGAGASLPGGTKMRRWSQQECP